MSEATLYAVTDAEGNTQFVWSEGVPTPLVEAVEFTPDEDVEIGFVSDENVIPFPSRDDA